MLTIIGMCFFSCDSGDDDGVAFEEFKRQFFNVENASFSGSEFPSATTNDLDISDVSGNPYVLAGGGNIVSVSANVQEIKELLIGVQGENGFFSLPVSSSSSGSFEKSFTIQTSQEIGSGFVIIIALKDAYGDVGIHDRFSVEYLEAGTGLLQVSVVWDQLTDVDLHLLEPGGEEIYWANDVSSNGGELDVDSNPDCDIDGINNENIFYSENDIVEGGEYVVGIHLFSACVSAKTNYSISVWYNGVAVNPTYGTNPYSGELYPSDVDDIKMPMKFRVEGNKSVRVIKYGFSSKPETKSSVIKEGGSTLK